MKRIYWLAALLALSAPAHAGSSISFSVGGHRIHIEASRHCRSTSCASVSVSGLYNSRGKRDRFEDDDAAPAKPAVPTVSPPPPPANIPPAPTVVVSAPPAVYKPAAAVTQTVAAPPPPPPVQQAAIPLPPPPRPPVQQVAIPLPRHRLYRLLRPRFPGCRTRSNRKLPIARSATGRPKARARSASPDAATRCAATFSIHRQMTAAKRC